MSRSWSNALAAWLHDPPDKCLDIAGHEARAARYAQIAMGRAVSRAELEIDTDPLASATERMPMPNGRDSSRRVEPGDGLRSRHPLAAPSWTAMVDNAHPTRPCKSDSRRYRVGVGDRSTILF